MYHFHITTGCRGLNFLMKLKFTLFLIPLLVVIIAGVNFLRNNVKRHASILLTSITFYANPCLALNKQIGARAFETNCMGCHSGGGNVISPNKGLTKEALLKYQIFDNDKLYNIVLNGKGIQMPAYGKFVSPKGNLIAAKLSDSEISAVVKFILDEAEKGWPSDDPLIRKTQNCDEYPGC